MYMYIDYTHMYTCTCMLSRYAVYGKLHLEIGLSVVNYILLAIIILYLPMVCTIKFVYNKLRQIIDMENGYERLLPT